MGIYRQLDANKTIETIHLLNLRIDDRFPSSGLSRVCSELGFAAAETRKRIQHIERPNWWLRGSVILLILLVLAGLVYSFTLIDFDADSFKFSDVLTVAEAGINDVVLIAAAVFFLFRLENRIKRRKALAALNELRSIAHVIDMHQLTKYPGRKRAASTEHSPKVTLSNYELGRYLDYCSEMLALTSKVAALYASGFDDEVVLDTVNEIEDMTTGMSRKIWQKIMILDHHQQDGAGDISQAAAAE